MPYTPQTWANGPGGLTPVNATRLNYMEAGIASAGGGGGGTLVVYASDAASPIGDYVCDGTADEVQINAAINALPNGRGTVVLSEGTFTLGGSIVFDTGTNVMLVGQGAEGYNGYDYNTYVTLVGAISAPLIDIRQFSSAIVRDISLDNSSTDTSSDVIYTDNGSTGLVVQDCTIAGNGNSRYGVYLQPSAAIIRNCAIWTNQQCVYSNAGNGPYYLEVTGSYLYSNSSYAIESVGSYGTPDLSLIGNTGNTLLVSGCFSDGNGKGVLKTSGGHGSVTVLGNYFLYDQGTGGTCTIECTDTAGLLIANNQFGGTSGTPSIVKLTNCLHSQIQDNLFSFGVSQSGIHILDSDHILVSGNLMQDIGIGTNDTYSGILLDGDTNECLVYGNMIRPSASANKLKYAIRIDDSTCDDNMVYGNDVKGSYVTAGVSDAGTGTITTASNRT